jgi:hypothetical protein
MGKIDLPGGEFKHTLRLERCCIGDGIILLDATIPSLGLEDCYIGPVKLLRTKVNGGLGLTGAHLFARGGPAMEADGLTVTGDVWCNSGFRAEGTVTMTGANIGGALIFTGAHLDGKGGPALIADRITVTGGISCDQGSAGPEPGRGERFRAHGGISLRGANVGQLELSGAWLDGTPRNVDRTLQKDAKARYALDADQLSVTRAIYCNDGFYAKGLISLRGASARQLNFRDAQLDGVKQPDSDPDDDRKFALDAQDLTVTSEMLWDGIPKEDGGRAVKPFHADNVVIVAGAKVGRLCDDKESWPKYIQLDGLTYGDLSSPEIPVDDRLLWLEKAPYGSLPPLYKLVCCCAVVLGRDDLARRVARKHQRGRFSPQPYQQLAAFYRGLGRDDLARRVLLKNQRLRRRQRWPWLRWWGWVQDGLAGYGYAPFRALAWLGGAFVAGLLVFRSHPPAPADPTAHTMFNAWVYTSDVLIPTQVFGQLSNWDPHGITLVVTLVLRLFGWVLAITVAAAIGRSFIRS